MEYDSKKLLIIVVLLLIWNYTTSKTKEIYFTTTKVEEVKINKSDLLLLARIIYAEAGHEKEYDGLLGVGQVVLNRAERKKTSIRNIIYQKGQFDGIRSKNFKYRYKTCKLFKVSLQAARELLEGKRILPKTVEFFHNPITSTDTGWTRYLQKTARKNPPIDIGNHRFFHNPNLV